MTRPETDVSAGNSADQPPTLSLPALEAAYLRDAFRKARVILEYGSGGSTVLAAGMPGKLIFSVESDPAWALKMQRYLYASDLASPVVLHYVDIGPVGPWGRPMDCTHWQEFHRYPSEIWDEPFFRQPDLVFVDGRFRAACLAITRLRTAEPVTVLIDDYAERPTYHKVEVIVGPPGELIGRMARFDLEPGPMRPEQVSDLLGLFFEATYAMGARYDSRTAATPRLE